MPGVTDRTPNKKVLYKCIKILVLQLYTAETSIEFNENENGMEQDFCSMF